METQYEDRSIGEIIRSGRVRLGWDQAELAHRVGASQQTVSGWERGTSRPRRPHVAQLAPLLEVNVAELLRAAGYGVATDGREQDRVLADPRRETLPIDDLGPETFERFSADLLHLLYPDAEIHRFGGPGDTQDGIDVLITHPDGSVLAAQCKRRQQFGPADIRKAVSAAAATPAAKYLLLLTRGASPDARKEISKYATWSLWDKEDIARVVRYELPRDRAVQLVQTYFPAALEPFLGVPAPGPWRTPREHFEPLSGEQLYSQRWDLVGRHAELEGMAAFVERGNDRVGALLGRGGIGKTRLIRALTDRLARDGRTEVRILDGATPVGAHDFEMLPTSELVVVVDDAHERGDIAVLIEGIRRVRPQAKVLLSFRPYAFASLADSFRRLGLYTPDIPRWDLADLSVAEGTALAQQVLGSELSPEIARRIGGMTVDCPLVTVVGAGLVRRGRLDPNRLLADADVRQEVLLAFRNSLVADAVSGDPELRRAVLDATAILQPVRLDDVAFRQALAEITEAPFDRVMLHIRSLEDGGVLLRRGQSVRVVPDLLGDVILSESAIERGSQLDTGYINRVSRLVRGAPGQHVFVNVCRIDWQLRQDNESSTSLAGSLWGSVRHQLETADVVQRLELLQLLKKVAYFQPQQVMELIDWVLTNPVPEVDDGEAPPYMPTQEDLLRALPPLLLVIGYDFAYLREACNRLWLLARNDRRPINQTPDHPIRVLQELARFQMGKPLDYSSAVVAAVGGWLTDESLDLETTYSPLEVLKVVLETEGAERTSDGLAISFLPHLINPDVVQEVRAQALDLVLRELRSPDLRRAITAAQVLREGLHHPRGQFGRAVPGRERARWTPLLVGTVRQLGRSMADATVDPIIHVALREALDRHLSRSSDDLATAAAEVLARFPDTLESRLALVLHDGWGHILLDPQREFEENEAQLLAHFAKVADELVAAEPGVAAVRLLATRLAAEQQAYGEAGRGRPAPFLSVLFKRHEPLASAVCEEILDDEASPLVDALSLAIAQLLTNGSPRAVSWARRLAESDSLQVVQHVIKGMGSSRSSDRAVLDGITAVLQDASQHAAEEIRGAVARAVRVVGVYDPTAAAELVSQIRFGDSNYVAEQVCLVLGRRGVVAWTELTDIQRERILTGLVRLASINEYPIQALIAEISRTDPATVVDLLIRRIELASRSDAGGLQPLPFEWQAPLEIRANERFPQILGELLEWVAHHVHDWFSASSAAEVFAAVTVDTFDDQVVRMLEEACATEQESWIRAVGVILSKAPRDLVWKRVDFVRRILQVAQRVSDEAIGALTSGMRSAVISGIRTGVPGKPFREDVEQRDRSLREAEQLSYGSVERRFYESLAKSAEQNIRWEVERDDLPADRRDW